MRTITEDEAAAGLTDLFAKEKAKPNCNGVYCGGYGSECHECELHQACEAKRKEIDAFVGKYGTTKILPFLHGASVALYAEEHLDMKEAEEADE